MNKIRIVYYSGMGNTYEMVKAFAEGVEKAGAETRIYRVTEKDKLDYEDIFSSDLLVIASSACGAESIQEKDFIPFIMDNKEQFNGRKVILFGAWGWGKGEFLDIWRKNLTKLGALVHDEIITSNENPDEETLEALRKLGAKSINL